MKGDGRTDPWPFGTDADRGDQLTQFRIAVTSSHPMWRYLVAFDRESEVRPTVREVQLLQSFLAEYIDHWYNDRFKAILAERLLDVDGGANGIVFHKYGEDDWGYRRQSYERGWIFTVLPPWARDREEYAKHEWPGPLSLAALMDRIHTLVDEQSRHWVQWKAAHPDLFPATARGGASS